MPKRRCHPLLARAPHGQRIYQHRPADWQDRPTLTTTVEDPDGGLVALAQAAYSTCELDHGRIRRPFLHVGRLWIGTAISAGALGGPQAWCREVVPLAGYTGTLRLWREHEPYVHGWTGRVVACGSALYVVLDHELHIRATSQGPAPQQLALWGGEHG